MERGSHRRGTVEGRHAWFVAFDREFRKQFAHGRLNLSWSASTSEAEWRVWMQESGEARRTISIDLPPNYSLFQPLAVAINTVLRLRDMSESMIAQSPAIAAASS